MVVLYCNISVSWFCTAGRGGVSTPIDFPSILSEPPFSSNAKEDTCKRYLNALRGLQDDGEHAATTRAVQSFLQGDGPALQERLKQWAAGRASCISIRYIEIAPGPTFFDHLAAISKTFGERSIAHPRTLSHYRSTGTRATCRSNAVVLVLNPFFVLEYVSFNLIIC